MFRIQKYFGIVLSVLLLLGTAVPAAAVQLNADGILRDMIAYYFHYRDKADLEIENQLEILSGMDPVRGDAWTQIMEAWAWTNEEMEVTMDVLPDGLPQEDTLCIVVLGYGLNEDGSMKQELLDRLEVALRSAEKYPQAYVLCTGGETAHVSGVSEAGQMGAWLLGKGLTEDRLLMEADSLSTTENARNCCQLLRRDYPQVSSIAIVSSDYHIPWGSILFTAEGILKDDGFRVVGNAACRTEKTNTDTMYSQAWGLSVLAGIPFDSSYVPTRYMTEQESVSTETEAIPLPASVPVQEETLAEEPVTAVLLGTAAVLLLIFIPKKRKTSGSD